MAKLEQQNHPKIFFVIDTSQTVVGQQVEYLVSKIGADRIPVHSLSDVFLGGGLFGAKGIYTLNAETKEDLRGVHATLEAHGQELLKQAPCGVIIYTHTVKKVSAKKFIDYLKSQPFGVVHEVKAGRGRTKASEIYEELGLSRDVQNFLNDFYGEDTDGGLALSAYFHDLSASERAQLTINDVAYRLVGSKGVKAPWGIENHLLNGDAQAAVDIVKRNKGREILVTHVLKSKFRTWLILRTLSDSRVSDPDIQKITGLKNDWAYKTNVRQAKSLRKDVIIELLTLALTCDHHLKGGSRMSAQTTVLTSLLKMENVIRRG